MKNCQKCRPCCGHQGGKIGRCCKEVEVIVEPTVYCRTEQHHHKCVRHIIPVVCHKTHHHHKHHEFEVKRKFKQEHRHHEHGRCDRNWCKKDVCNFNQEHRQSEYGRFDGDWNEKTSQDKKDEAFINPSFENTSQFHEEQYM